MVAATLWKSHEIFSNTYDRILLQKDFQQLTIGKFMDEEIQTMS